MFVLFYKLLADKFPFQITFSDQVKCQELGLFVQGRLNIMYLCLYYCLLKYNH